MTLTFITACIGPKYVSMTKSLIESIVKFYPYSPIVLFTDQTDFPHSIEQIMVDTVPNPLPALLRYHYILHIGPALFTDYVYWIDADCEILAPLERIAFSPLVAAGHPWFDMVRGPFEDNPKSTAYVECSTYHQYLQGSFQGGRRHDFLAMSKKLRNNIEEDLKNRIIARWYDESHLNWFAYKYPLTLLHPGYAYPDNMAIPYPKIILHRNGHEHVPGFD